MSRALDDVDLLLRVLVDDRRDQRLQLDRVLLILEELQLERAAQAIVRVPLELLALDRERADEVHDLAPEVVFAVLGDLDLLFDRPHQALVRLLVLAGVAVLDLLLERVGLDVVDVVARRACAIASSSALIARWTSFFTISSYSRFTRPMISCEALPLLVVGDERVVAQALLELVHAP